MVNDAWLFKVLIEVVPTVPHIELLVDLCLADMHVTQFLLLLCIKSLANLEHVYSVVFRRGR